MARRSRHHKNSHYERTALVLQGGGALGAYQVGVYEALGEAGCEPDWIAGTSIGAINAALIAGSPPARRIERLTEFWQTISRPGLWPEVPAEGELRRLYGSLNAVEAMTLGQPGFFRPRAIVPWLMPSGTAEATSYYDAGPLRETLARLVDFDQINDGAVRLSVGAVELRSGREVFFDSAREEIRIDHILASGALPPAFAPVAIGDGLYWDGAIMSNTPLDVVLDDERRVSTLCFMVDLFDHGGPAPASMQEVIARHKDITYSSRSRRHIDSYRALHNMRRAVAALWRQLPDEARADPHIQELAALGCSTTMNIVHFVYRSRPFESAAKDYEFSRASIADHRAAGYRDGRTAVAERRWLAPVPPDVGVVVHEVGAPAQ